MGLVQFITANIQAGTWGLSSSEGDVKLRSPAEVTDVRITFQPNQTVERTISDLEGTVVPTTNGPTSVSMTATWNADHRGDDIADDVGQALSTMAMKDPKLKRRPVCQFDYGKAAIECWVTSCELSYPFGQFRIPPFNYRGIRASITLMRAQSRAFEITGAPKVRQTSIRRLGEGDTFEFQAWIKYGDPYLAILVRRYNPEVALDGERQGDVIRLYERDHPAMTGSVAPISAPFVGDFAEVVQHRAEARLGWGGPGFAALEEELGLA
jgi:hypothetical protein